MNIKSEIKAIFSDKKNFYKLLIVLLTLSLVGEFIERIVLQSRPTNLSSSVTVVKSSILEMSDTDFTECTERG